MKIFQHILKFLWNSFIALKSFDFENIYSYQRKKTNPKNCPKWYIWGLNATWFSLDKPKSESLYSSNPNTKANELYMLSELIF